MQRYMVKEGDNPIFTWYHSPLFHYVRPQVSDTRSLPMKGGLVLIICACAKYSCEKLCTLTLFHKRKIILTKNTSNTLPTK